MGRMGRRAGPGPVLTFGTTVWSEATVPGIADPIAQSLSG
jgi:hypothetical protein